jgi:hypothetical protein
MSVGTGNDKVPCMSVSSIGTSPFPATLPPLPGQTGQATKPNGQNANGGANTAANSASNTATANGVTNGGTTGVTSNAANTANNGANPLPPVQAATSPGTGQKVNVIA